jgi:hypothetical protein
LLEKGGFGPWQSCLLGLRATAIVLWIRAEVPLTTVRSLAGHASLAATDRYARIARNDLTGGAEQVNSYISRTRGGHGPTAQDQGNVVE